MVTDYKTILWNRLVCYICKRKLPDNNFRTKNGCIWCDKEFHKEKNNG